MKKYCIEDINDNDTFLFFDKLKCKKIGQYSLGCYIIAPIQEEESIKIAKKHGFWMNDEGTVSECKQVIETSSIEGVYPIYYAVGGGEMVELFMVDPTEYRDESYLFPNVKDL